MTREQTIAALGKLIAGIQKHPPPGPLEINGKTYTAADVVQVLQAIIDSLNAAASARATYLEAVKKSEAHVSDNESFVSGVRQIVYVMYGQSQGTLEAFGLTPHKKPTLTTAAKIASIEKGKATRAARGTRGSKQAAAIVGDVTGVTITPITGHVTAAGEATTPQATPPTATGASVPGAAAGAGTTVTTAPTPASATVAPIVAG